MDEIHVACRKNQTILKAFQTAGLLDKKTLYENDMKILEFTATPDGTIYNLIKWKESSNKIMGNIGDSYIGAYNFYVQGRLRQFQNLYSNKTNNPVIVNHLQGIKNEISVLY